MYNEAIPCPSTTYLPSYVDLKIYLNKIHNISTVMGHSFMGAKLQVHNIYQKYLHCVNEIIDSPYISSISSSII